jgi:hypothetical protein
MGHDVDPNMIFEENRRFGAGGKKAIAIFGALGLILVLAGLGLAMGSDSGMKGFFFSYLIGYGVILSLALGGLFFVMIHHLTKAGWSVSIRRIAEMMAGTLPLLALLALPIVIPVLLGDTTLYKWADHAKLEEKGRHADAPQGTLSQRPLLCRAHGLLLLGLDPAGALFHAQLGGPGRDGRS